MKKKTRRRLRKAKKQLQRSLGSTKTDSTAMGAALGGFALGSLVGALVKDPEIRARTRELASATLDRLLSYVGGDSDGASQPRQRDDEQADAHDAEGERRLRRAH